MPANFFFPLSRKEGDPITNDFRFNLDPITKLGERDDVNGLETWDDPTPRRSQWTVQDLCDAFVAASKQQLSLIPRRPPPKERARRRQERERSFLLNVALRKYATQNNIQVGRIEMDY